MELTWFEMLRATYEVRPFKLVLLEVEGIADEDGTCSSPTSIWCLSRTPHPIVSNPAELWI